jgi:Tol biopolymer transport system component
MSKIFSLFLAASLFAIIAHAQQVKKNIDNITVSIFAPGTISTPDFELNASFMPDGKTVYFTKSLVGWQQPLIMLSKKVNNQWQQPEVASFSGRWQDMNPYVSKDGKRIYFITNRTSNGEGGRDRNLYFTEIQNGAWSEPVAVPGELNDSFSLFFPTVTATGVVYFCATRPEGKGASDVYRSHLVNGLYQKPEPVVSINSEFEDADADVSPDGRLLVFASVRPGGLGGHDLYLSLLQPDGTWGAPQHLGNSINTSALDLDPTFTPDGKFVYFSSNRLATELAYKKPIKSLADVNDHVRKIENGQMNIYYFSVSEIVD